ncbi:putative J domain-containing protein C17A3.05c [Bienertia sinuspersici]
MDLHQFHHATTTANPNPNPTPNRAEAERLLGIAEKLLQTRDLTGSREFALLAQETEPLLEGSDQILAITDVLLASESRVVNNRHHDWYAILQTNPQSLSADSDLLKKNYRRLALLLHPDKNRYPLADSAFKLVADAWALLSDPSRKGLYDHELNVYSKVELRAPPNNEKDKLPVRRSPRADEPNPGHTPRPAGPGPTPHQKRGGVGVGSGVNCERAFHASAINSLPPIVPGGVDISDGSASAGFGNANNNTNVAAGFAGNLGPGMPKKRGRPRKNPMAV